MKDTTRKQRTVMMTDAEWQDLKETAAAAGMRVSASIIHRLATRIGDADNVRSGDTEHDDSRSPGCQGETFAVRPATHG